MPTFTLVFSNKNLLLLRGKIFAKLSFNFNFDEVLDKQDELLNEQDELDELEMYLN